MQCSCRLISQPPRFILGPKALYPVNFLLIDHTTISSSTSPYHPPKINHVDQRRFRSAIVRALYEGLLVNPWTTAPNHLRRWGRSARLAALFALLAVAGGAADVAKPPPSRDYSKNPSSNLALSRLFIPRSDTSIIRRPCDSTVRSKRAFESAELARTDGGNDLDQAGVRESGGSVNGTRVTLNETFHNDRQRNDSVSREEEGLERGTQWPMPPAHAHDEGSGGTTSSTFFLVAVLVTGAVLGLVTCLLSHHQQWGQADPATGAGTPATRQEDAAPHLPPTSTPMLSVVSAGAAAGMGGMERLRSGGGGGGRSARELAAARDRQVRLHSVRADLAVDLPPRIALPDGEDRLAAPHARLHLRDHEQESEIYQKCIRPPPNRTVLESESPPPYRSSSAGVLPSSSSSSTSSSSSGGDWSTGSGPLVVRCHSMSSASKPAGHPGQKTDFLQRTVKIFTGGKRGAPAQQGRGRPPAV